jgi:predicted metal-dependent peptidase
VELKQAQKALDRVKIALMERSDTLFYTTVFFSLDQEWDTDIPTACTNGYKIKFNPDFFLKQSPAQQMGLVLHETEHVAFMHMARGETFDDEKWNCACDYVINQGLIDRGFKLPEGGLWDTKYRNMSAEEVYAILPDPPEGYTMDLVMGDSPEEGGTGNKEASSDKALKEHINDILIRAAMQVRMAGADPGQIPGHIQVYLDKLLNPKLPWDRILSKYCHAMKKTDYSFRKPNRRYFPDMLLPSQHGEAMGKIAVALDMSGSVTDAQSTHFATEVYKIVKRLDPKLLQLAQFDTQIKSVTDITSVNDLKKVTYHGRGGTAIAPVIDWIADTKPDVAIIFTDGEFRHYTRKSKTPIIWVIHSNPKFKPPYGKVIHYDITP